MKLNSISTMVRVTGVLMLLIPAAPVPALTFTEYAFDDNTVLLDHFNGSTGADYVNGALSYVDGADGLGRAAEFMQGEYARYHFSDWGYWEGGSVEMMVNPAHYGENLLNLNWGMVSGYPPAGHVLHVFINAEGKLCMGGWDAAEHNVWTVGEAGRPSMGLDEWSHVAYTWGPGGSRLWLNGKVIDYTPDNGWPSLYSPTYAYLNYWGEGDTGFVDEFRISNVSRDFSSIADDFEPAPVPEPSSLALLGTGLLGLLGAGRNRFPKKPA